MDESITTLNTPPIRLRTLRASDEAAIAALLEQGQPLVGSMPVPALTPHTVKAEYFDHPPNHLWVAEVDDLVVGLAGLVHEQPMVARLQLLYIDSDWDAADVAEPLLQTAVRHCHYFGYLKLVAPAVWPTDELLALFSRCGLRFTRHREAGGHLPCVLEFYVDLYRRGGDATVMATANTEAEQAGSVR
ncbi:MAG: hypothetical protein WD534_16280 [Phycisphaeraceae bacterium]